MLKIDQLVCRAGGREIVSGVSTVFRAGLLHVIVGPNGSGKSTFLKAFSGDWRPESGTVFYDGVPLSSMNKIALARRRAVMSQLPELHFPLGVDEIVGMGRYPHFSFQPSARDKEICREAMERLGIAALTGRDYLTLSGGERQRVQFARALAQIWDAPATDGDAPGPSAASPGTNAASPGASTASPGSGEERPGGACRYLFLDEPVSSLDIRYQHQILQIARSLVRENIVLVIVLHDLNLALQYGDRILLMKEGRIAAEGSSPGIITPGLIREIFDIPARLLDNPYGGTPVIVYG